MSDEREPVNIGNPHEMTILEFAEAILRADRLDSRRSSSSRCPVDDPKIRQPDITRARRILGWEPRVPLDDGLGRTIDYFRTLAPSRAGEGRA